MTKLQELERLISQEIKIISSILNCESEKMEAIARADMDLVNEWQKKSERLFSRLEQLEESISEKKASVNFEQLPAEHQQLNRLVKMRDKKAREALAANKENQKILTELLREMKVQIEHIRQGRKALSGYQRGLGSDKRPKILSDEV